MFASLASALSSDRHLIHFYLVASLLFSMWNGKVYVGKTIAAIAVAHVCEIGRRLTTQGVVHMVLPIFGAVNLSYLF